MTLSTGARLGPYEILSPIGAGGMGEVYRARDTRLDRTVAVKVLPGHLSSDPERRQRFEREARAVSSLHHPHICVLYDIGHQDGIDYLVMECLEGETLADRLGKGPLSLDQALRHGIEIADALDKAHRQGVVHRDLKPANVMLTKAGAKLLDFGLAKQARVLGVGEPSVLATRTQETQDKSLTGEGTLIGTPQYMAPEQLDGKEADARTDIWALGLVLYEMTTGKKAFSGKSQASLAAAILKEEPLPLAQLQPLTPPSLERLVKTCLAKDPDERWQSAHDVVAQLRWIAEGPAEVRAQYQRGGYWAWIVAGLLAAALTAVLSSRRQPAEARVVRASISLPDGTAVDSISLSPDGRHLAYAGSAADGRTLLWLRPLEGDAARPLPGTEGAAFPFWSPDNRSLGFFAEGSLKKVDVTGGPVEALCGAFLSRGGTWSREGVIVFSRNVNSGLDRISATGGPATPVTTLDSSRRETSHRWPHFLPDGRHVLYYSVGPEPEGSGIYVASLDSKETRRLTAATSHAAYAPPGYLLFERGGALVAQPFDPQTQRLGGDPVAVSVKVASDLVGSRALFGVSESGVLAYQTAAGHNRRVAWFDRGGKSLGVLASSENSYNLSLSRDDKRLAVSRSASARDARDIWVYDLRGTHSRLTFDPRAEIVPTWSPDGSRIVYSSNRDGPFDLYQKPSSGTANEEPLLKTNQAKYATDWSADGRFVVYDSVDPESNVDLWVLPMTGERKPVPFLQTGAEEAQARFSPDGRWLAYTSNESGRPEVYVQSFPASGGKWQVSGRGGAEPKWRRDGKELFYISLDQKLMALSVRLGTSFGYDPPHELFEAHGIELFGYRSPYAVTGDGQRFFFSTRSRETTSAPIQLVLNWTAGLKR